MGALYIIIAITLAGVVNELVSAIAGNGTVGEYDYHFAPGVGAVFGASSYSK
jgi:hypothetical protein